jgi:ornithine cyclodeaminase
MLLISSAEIPDLLPIAEAVPLMRKAYVSISRREAALAQRQALELPSGTGLLMGAAEKQLGFGAKLVAVMPGNKAQDLPGSIGLVALLDDATGKPLALLDGTSLTSLRTAALNACAIDLLARKDARIALLVGCGTQAEEQLAAMATVRDLKEIRVLGREAGRVSRFIRRNRDRVSIPLQGYTEPETALRNVDLVTSVTNSMVPVLPGARVPAGCHVSGIGSFRPGMREFDEALVRRAGIFVESRETALEEAGELIAAHEAGVVSPESWTEIGEVISGTAPGRKHPDQVTFFKSVGHAVFDLHAARAIYESARERRAGQRWQP